MQEHYIKQGNSAILRGSVISNIINALFIIGSKSSMNANKYQLTKK